MPNPGKKHKTDCPVAFALDAVGDRWTLLIVRDILFKGSETYGEFLESGEGFATNILADRLKIMEGSGILSKSRDPDNHRRYIYRLTEKGRGLTPIVLEMIRWSAEHDPDTSASKAVADRIGKDRDGLVAEIRARLTGN